MPLLKKQLVTAAVLFSVTLCSAALPASSAFVDDFNDGNTDGWWLGFSHHTPWVNGNWRVEDGVLVHDQGGDAFIALAEGVQFSSHSVATDVWLHGPAGYGGVTLWCHDEQNWTAVFVYPAAVGVWVQQKINGVSNETRYPIALAESSWHRLAVDSDATTGLLDVSINGSHLFTHQAIGATRSGRSGVYSGNSGGYFDNVHLESLNGAAVFRGLYDPVLNPPVLNRVRAGAGVPIRFSLGAYFGLDLFVPGFPVSTSIDCDGFGGGDAIEETLAPGHSGLSYDAALDQYTFVWKTDRSWSNSCRQLFLQLNNGFSQVAYFQFVKK